MKRRQEQVAYQLVQLNGRSQTTNAFMVHTPVNSGKVMLTAVSQFGPVNPKAHRQLYDPVERSGTQVPPKRQGSVTHVASVQNSPAKP